VWGIGNGKNGKYEYTKEEIEQNFLKVYTYEAWIIKQEAEADIVSTENETPREETNSNESKSKRKEIEEEQREKSSESSESNKKLKSDSEIETKGSIHIEGNVLTKNQLQDGSKSSHNTSTSRRRPGFDPNRFERDPECFECAQTYRDPTRKDLIMYLHAYSYQFDDLKFNTQLPEWAHEDFCESE
jgi:hypothetical protein